jgi:hypothetical protein
MTAACYDGFVADCFKAYGADESIVFVFGGWIFGGGAVAMGFGRWTSRRQFSF